MPNESTNLKLKLYDPDVDANALVYDLLKDICGYTNSNFVKIDTNINDLHNHIIGTDGNVVFYNKQEVFLAVHPVGSIFLSTDDVEPAGLYGGTWEKIAEERTLMGASTAHPVNTTVEAGLPNITGLTYFRGLGIVNGKNQSVVWDATRDAITTAEKADEDASSIGLAWERVDYSSNKSGKLSFDASKSNTIYGNSTTVQPATYYINIWKRIE